MLHGKDGTFGANFVLHVKSTKVIKEVPGDGKSAIAVRDVESIDSSVMVYDGTEVGKHTDHVRLGTPDEAADVHIDGVKSKFTVGSE